MYTCTSLHDPHDMGHTWTPPDQAWYSRVVAMGSYLLLGLRLAHSTGGMSSRSVPTDSSADGQ